MDVREKLLKQAEHMEEQEREEYIDFLHRLFERVDSFGKPTNILEKYERLTGENKVKADRYLDVLVESQDNCQGGPRFQS